MEDLSSKTLKELKEYAQENNIDIKNARSKSKIIAEILGFESSLSGEKENKQQPISNALSNENNVVVSGAANNTNPKKDIEIPQEVKEKIAIFSEKNMHWLGVGHLKTGYNIVPKEAASKWLTMNSVREATPEEVATYYGKA